MRFRPDLYYRLNIIPLQMPALREHPEDIPALVEHLAKSFSRRHGVRKPTFSAKVMRRLLAHTWPGNVRELANAVERLVILAEQGTVDEIEFDGVMPGPPQSHDAGFLITPAGMNWQQHERDCIQQAMAISQGNRSRAAKLLGLTYKAFLYRLDRVQRDCELE